MIRGGSRDRDHVLRGDEQRGEVSGDKSARSVFVGNIPYEATEEKLKEIFSEVGVVVSFKLVYDRENGKPRGYGFCEYQNPETAMCAMRNLNGYEIGGRTLRVDSACTEKNRMEMQSVMAGPNVPQGAGPIGFSGLGGQAPVDNGPFGQSVEPEKAPEAISKAVASLPPEQMFELMKQMKICIQNNPEEARNMLLQNPQLAYALLQAQVVMRIVEPEMALQMLHKNHHPPLSLGIRGEPVSRGSPMQQGMMPGVHPGTGGLPVQDQGPFGADAMGTNRSCDERGGQALFEREMDRRMDDQSQRYGGRDPRNRDPRGGGSSFDPRGRRESTNAGQPNLPVATSDPARNQLIMQVLQLTDEQIAMLPLEQQTSIMELKKQVNQQK